MGTIPGCLVLSPGWVGQVENGINSGKVGLHIKDELELREGVGFF